MPRTYKEKLRTEKSINRKISNGTNKNKGVAGMKITGKLSSEEMEKRNPDLMAALRDPNAIYCMSCDGLRIHKNLICTVCGERYYHVLDPRLEEKT